MKLYSTFIYHNFEGKNNILALCLTNSSQIGCVLFILYENNMFFVNRKSWNAMFFYHITCVSALR